MRVLSLSGRTDAQSRSQRRGPVSPRCQPFGLQQMLGHADASLALGRYSHLVPSDSRTAADKLACSLLSDGNVTTGGHSEDDLNESTEVAQVVYQRRCVAKPS